MIDLRSLPRRPWAVLGLGASGRAAARALLAAGHTVWAWDDGETARARAAGEGIPLVDLAATDDLAESAALVLSPGIPHTYPVPHPVVVRARDLGVEIIGDVELLFRVHPDGRYVGISGTNGKSTTTALIGHIFALSGGDVRVGGNLGPPVLAFDPPTTKTICVLEMSSYQLELTPSLVFNAAVMLNISPDHLSRHGGMEGYIAAKQRIFGGARLGATAVIGVDDDPSRAICTELYERHSHRVLAISGRRRVGGGAFVTGGALWDAIEGDPKHVAELGKARALPGEHNGQNAAAAYAAARALGVPLEACAEAILSFPGLPHRQERIAVIDGVAYVNDSKATNGDAAARALASYERIYWIAGGRPKEDGLAATLPWLDRVRAAFLIGESEEAFAGELDGKAVVVRCGTLAQAFAAARTAAQADAAHQPVVLLSPACASFDQFPNFEVRGDAFRALVKEIAA
ncbi:MAG: UDP-N-acetylmuramoyl-L-alanine--D-glutamate ligase [Rhodospirillales bacterium]|nr:UDP-N-acetylmuramoyl-L-alanine--D-glutamate ligase [Rhodospirillales bacterium]